MERKLTEKPFFYLRIEKYIKNSKVNNFLFRMPCLKNWIMKIKLRHSCITYKYIFFLPWVIHGTYREIYIIWITINIFLNVLEMLLIFQGRDVLMLNFFSNSFVEVEMYFLLFLFASWKKKKRFCMYIRRYTFYKSRIWLLNFLI